MKYDWWFHFHLYLYEDSLHSQLRQMSCPLITAGSSYTSNSLCHTADMCRTDNQSSHSKPALSCFIFAGFTRVCWHFLKQFFFKQKCTLLGPLDHEEGAMIPWNVRKYPKTHCHNPKKIRTFSTLAVRTSNLTKNAFTLSCSKWHGTPLKFWKAEVQWDFHF